MGRYVTTLNGVSIAYTMGVINAFLAMLFSFGVHITSDQRGYVVAFVNACFILVAHVSYAQGKKEPPTDPSSTAG